MRDDVAANADGQRVITGINRPDHQGDNHLILSAAVAVERALDPALVMRQQLAFHRRFRLVRLHSL